MRHVLLWSNLTKVLEVLEIKSTNGCDFGNIYDPQDFKDVFESAQFSRNFGWVCVIGITWTPTWLLILINLLRNCHCATLVQSPSFTILTTGSSTHLTWLPQLKSFQLTVDPESCVRDLEGDAKLRVPFMEVVLI